MKFTTEPNQLTITLEGLERLWALKGRLQIPHYAIESIVFVSERPQVQDLQGRLRFPGVAIPWRFRAGSFIREGHREFWYLQMNQPGHMMMTLKPEAINYDRVRLTSTPEIAQTVMEWWQSHK